MAVAPIESVASVQAKIFALLQKARQVKPSTDIDPPLNATEVFKDEPWSIEGNTSLVKGVVEAAARNIFYDTVANVDIEDPEFVRMWNLFDILQHYEDEGQTAPALVLWLLEELLDSQNIQACRRVFDYMESRREVLMARDFANKNLVILRTSNELLRRLSRAEDAVFCGRVFIFMFLVFPLGDKSSVNPKGDFHIENVTTFEESPREAFNDVEKMDVDENLEVKAEQTIADGGKYTTDIPKLEDDKKIAISDQVSKIDTNELYPTFWKLQQSFSNPTRLFVPETFEEFKTGLQLTLQKFREVPTVSTGDKLGVGRRLSDNADEFASTFNPKYLTSRDLFRLELSDLAFQRHILVQALILIDFLLSLTEKSKNKLAPISMQKALRFSFTLADPDAEWALGIKRTIVNYLQEGPDGKFYHRMVEVVLSRDKNWVRWKLENCPEIKRAPVSAEVFQEAKSGAQKACATRRMRAAPMGSLDLSFLSASEGLKGLEGLKNELRTTMTSLESYVEGIEANDLDMEMADDGEKTKLQESKNNQTWRALRIASRSKLSRFEKIDDGKKIRELLGTDVAIAALPTEPSATDDQNPKDGPEASAKSTEGPGDVSVAEDSKMDDANSMEESRAESKVK